MPDFGGMARVCVLCGKSAGLMCQRCWESYCSVVCQTEDWQRHKAFCIIMPPLVACRDIRTPMAKQQADAVTPAIAETKPNKTPNTPDAPVVVPVLQPKNTEEQRSTNWRQHQLPVGEEFFECRVTSMEKEGPFWVLHLDNVDSMERMHHSMQRLLQNGKLTLAENIQLDSLVIITADSKVHRGQVLSVDSATKEAEIRLIDVGSVLTIPLRDIYAPVSKMAERKAYAFRVKLPTNTGVQVNKNLSLRLLGTRTHEGIYQVQLKPKMTIPLGLPLEMLQLNPEVKVIRIFDCNAEQDKVNHVALLQINVLDYIDKDLNDCLAGKPGQPFSGPFPEGKTTFYVASRSSNGSFRRAFLLDLIEKPTPKFLVYEMDHGRVSITNELTRIPSELLGLPIRVFAVQLDDYVPQSLLHEHADLAVKFNMDILPRKETTLRSADASLLCKGEQICVARLSTFMGQVCDLGHKYWREPIADGAFVFISHVESYKEVFISSKQSKQYVGIFKSLAAKCEAFEDSSKVPIGSIVLVVSPSLGHFRGEVSSVEDGLFEVQNVDTGASHKLKLSELRKSCRFLENLPVSLMRIQLNTICTIQEVAVPANNSATPMLEVLCAQKEELSLRMVDKNTATADLLFSSGEQRSLANRMVQLIFLPIPGSPNSDAASTSSEPILPDVSAALPPSPPNSPDQVEAQPVKRFYFKDLTKKLVPLGDNVDIMTLSTEELRNSGYITALHFESESDAENFQSSLNLVASHGECAHNVVVDYVPCIGEVCAACYSGDNVWYRGVCQEIKDGSALIFYYDFGNTEYVDFKDLKPLNSNLLHVIYATKCYIDGFDKTENQNDLEVYLSHQRTFSCSVMDGPETDTRLIRIPRF
ncbi:uncharacterized protein LOC110186459 isoform X2 [Drosophila serrata]|uniref:uncharacterized protein LOC110186459 isoform X2 n=1 Tax=Drosophila serrata TaxID=7274 RepID=UPI000A1D037C|nr:uncharacterized protein LOC110186459 isoform X2 [Drosophila serrata]